MSTPEPTIPNVLTQRLSAVSREQKGISAELFRRVMTLAEILMDFLTTVLGIYIGYFLYFSLHIGRHLDYPVKEVAVVAGVVGMLIGLLMERDGAYKGDGSLLRIRETERAIRIPVQALLLFLPITFLFGKTFSRGALVIALVLVPILLIVQKHLSFSVVVKLHAKGYGVRRVVIYGGGYTGRRVLSALLHSPNLGLSPVVIIDDDPALDGSEVFELGYKRSRSVTVRCSTITPALLRSYRCNMLVIAIPSLYPEKLAAASRAAQDAGMDVAFLPSPAVQEHHWMESIDVDGLLLTSPTESVAARHYVVTKRLLDITISSILLVLLSPILVMIALLVRLDSPGPFLFVQKRVGKDGRLFSMYKFRSMRTDAPKYGFHPKDSTDPRITKMGRLLRKTSLDEIPQLVNVLKGDMSLVGPRPEQPFIVEGYDLRQRQRLQVLPGITGLWQLSADRAFKIHESIQYDHYYIRNRSFFLDMAILVHTLFFAMHGV